MKNATHNGSPAGRWRLRRCIFSGFFFLMLSTAGWAQQRTVSGTVSDVESGEALPGVNVILKGTTEGTVTDVQGSYQLSVPADGGTLVFSFIGLTSKEVEIGNQSTIDVTMEEDAQQLNEVVVTALGIERDEKALGYAVQEIDGESVSRTKETNVINSLSGKIAGVQVRSSNTLGGSANINIRGTSTIAGNNQPLFVVDGVPIDNSNYNSDDQQRGAGGFDLGNPAADINPQDIESISVLKGGSAAALYGSRALNGVILITTKKGSKRQGIGVSINSAVTLSQVNKNTLPQHQKEYGAGYGSYFEEADLDGDGVMEEIVPTYDDASWGYRFDPNRQVVHWDALDPNAPNYGETRPWVAGEHGIEDFFETGVSWVNNVALTGGTETSSFRLSYTNENSTGVVPNSEIDKNALSFNGSLDLSDKFTARASANYINQDVLGRYGTGYDGSNVMQSFGQWFQTNVDVARLRNYKNEVGEQRGWNYRNYDDLNLYYFDNPYWVRYENYENDTRDRLFGNVQLEYQLAEGLKVTGRSSVDFYDFIVEERIALGSAVTNESDYTKNVRTFKERNDDLFLTYNKDFGGRFSLYALVGANRRNTTTEESEISTFRGLVNPGVYSVSNSVSPEIEFEDDYSEKVQRSVYANVNLGYAGIIFLDLTARNDWSSTLPKGKNSYFYPSASASFVFTELAPLQNSSILSFGKLRVNYAEVGNDTDPYNTRKYFEAENSFGSSPIYREPRTLANPDLRSETKRSMEVGTELMFFSRRVGLDITLYKENTFDQIIDIPTSRATGYDFQYINAGNIENKGIELALNATPVEGDFTWNVSFNWAKNQNEVVELTDDLDNYQLGSNFFASINATEGEAFGTIRGTNFVYNDNGERIIGEDGFYLVSENEEVIGNATPNWNAGLFNSFTYKGFTLSGLIDMQQGGDIFSLNTAFGRATGLYEETAGLNDKGNPKRDLVADGGGIRFDGVLEDGTPNDIYIEANTWGTAYNYNNLPAALYVFDASYVKLRELSLSYTFPQSLLGDVIQNLQISAIGRNLAILYSNVTHFDPEVSRSSGNVQGYESGTYPTPRSYGFNVQFNF
uniref:SusC/RagA family TonB-linked outer membrane protein n=1 Tax=Roseihalotalea indica TaxID=2867963 RepID=A0AA49JHI2_9BACT|nr:SusC/RagA family TonB-linked outer membrane protein [Tunicatimonas sp. TK19036]